MMSSICSLLIGSIDGVGVVSNSSLSLEHANKASPKPVQAIKDRSLIGCKYLRDYWDFAFGVNTGKFYSVQPACQADAYQVGRGVMKKHSHPRAAGAIAKEQAT